MPDFNEDKYYSLANASTKDQRDEVGECLQFAVSAIYKQAKKETISPQLKTVINDLHDIRIKSAPAYETARLALTMYPTSYRKIATIRGVSHVAIYNQLRRLAANYDWIESIVDLMSENG